jgi:hypothetical protein
VPYRPHSLQQVWNNRRVSELRLQLDGIFRGQLYRPSRPQPQET